MTSKRAVLGWLAALALVAAACGGGGDAGPAPLAAGDVPIVPEVAGDAPLPEEGEIVEEEEAPAEGEEDPEGEAPATETEAEPAVEETYTYADDRELAATMMIVPADLGDVVPDLRVNAAHTGPLDSFAIYRRNAGAADVLEVDLSRRAVAGYEAMLVGPGTDEARERLGSPHPEVSMLAFVVELYGDDATAAARLTELRGVYQEIGPVSDQPGLPGDGFVLDGNLPELPFVTVGFAGHGVVGQVTAFGTTSAEPAVAAAQALAVRAWKASGGMLEPRDPLAEAIGYQVPSAALDAFEASADMIVSVDDLVLERVRWTGKYQGSDRFACQLTHYLGGTEELVAEVVAMGAEASVFDLETLSSGQYDVFSPEVSAAVADCPVFPQAWQEYLLLDPAMLHSDPASTIGGPGTTLRTRDEWRFAEAAVLQPAAGSELVDFSVFVTEEGWASAIHFEVAYPAEAALEAFGIAQRVTVRNSVRVTNVDGVEVPEPLYFGGDDSFVVGVGEEVLPPADEPAPADGGDGAAPGGDGGDAGGDAGSGGDVQAASGGASQDDGLFGSGSYGTGGGSGDSHFAGTSPVGGAKDASAQAAITDTMLGLVAFYVDNGHYEATAADVASYIGVVTTTDPGSGGESSTVFVPGDQETVVWAAGGSGYFCMAASANEVIVFGSGESPADVETFEKCVAGGSTVGW